MPDDGIIIAALRRACGSKIHGSLLTPKGVRPVRVLLEIGCDLERDIVPACEGCVRTLSRPLESMRAKFIHEAAMANRDEARRLESAQTAPGRRRQVFVEKDTDAWRAWLDYLGRKSMPTREDYEGARGRAGWLFDADWPPSADTRELKTATG